MQIVISSLYGYVFKEATTLRGPNGGKTYKTPTVRSVSDSY